MEDIITTRGWLDEGHSRLQLQTEINAGRLVRVRKGIVMKGDSPPLITLQLRKLRAAVRFLGPSSCFGFTSAAAIHGLPVLAQRLNEVVIVRTGGSHGAVAEQIHARRADLDASDISEVAGLPVTSLPRTVADLVRQLPFSEAVMVADAGLRMGLDRELLLNMTASGRGCRMAARALRFADGRSESAGESMSRVRIAAAGLPAPDLQHSFYDRGGNLIARSDFWWEKYGLVGEFDGKVKYGALLKPGQRVEDVVVAEKRREWALNDEGLTVVRWMWEDLWNQGVERRLRQAMTTITSRATQPH